MTHDQNLGLISNDDVCECVGCFEKSTTQIVIAVGEQKEITLKLCKDCVNKFEDK
jgi:hypothetical protein